MPSLKDKRLEAMLATLAACRRVCVLTHYNPDPDSISSAWALQRILVVRTKARAEVVYGGIIGRAENQLMVHRLGIELIHYNLIARSDFDAFALVDTQPGTGNNPLPEGIVPHIVIDHHPEEPATAAAAYQDVRPGIGAAATMLYEYAVAAGIRIDAMLATALFYGIKSETHNLGRGVTRADVDAYVDLVPRVRKDIISSIEHAPLTTAYFVMLDRAIKGTTIHGPLVLSVLGNVDNPDMVSECADLMLRLEHVNYAMAMGRFNGDLCVSFRTSDPAVEAGEVLKAVVGRDGTAGGHSEMAGGMVEGHGKAALGATRAACRELGQRLIKRLRIRDGAEGVPLLKSPDTTPSQQVIRALLRNGTTDARTG
ncbi:MAG: DHH family phosphoesterase [Planctomycetes bacterium]|nr:DHH family phosphoesterase [Planctomycetota bacterium]